MENIIEEYTELKARVRKMATDPRIKVWISYLDAVGVSNMETTIDEVNTSLIILSFVIKGEGGDLRRLVDLFNKKNKSKVQLSEGNIQFLSGCACCTRPAKIIEFL